MLMVCPNCHSDQVIAVQDQHFCINCGQMVPEPAISKVKGRPKVQSNGLPEGVEILPLEGAAADPAAAIPADPAAVTTSVAPVPEPAVEAVPPDPSSAPALIHGRSRLAQPDLQPATTLKRRKPGRPKAGRLDVPRAIASTAPASLPLAPKIAPPPPPSAPGAAAHTRSMSDLAPRRAPGHSGSAHPHASAHPAQAGAKPIAAKAAAPKPEKRPRAHRVGVPPLHYGPIIAFSFRTRTHPRLLGLAALGAASLGVAAAWGVWQLLTQGPAALAITVTHSGPRLAGEAALLALTYYIGRSLGQTAIIYGIAREADQRPVTLSRQFGIAVNTFARRILLDLGYGAAELLLILAGVALFITGGETWPMNPNLQVGLLFGAYLAILYLLSALALSRGLAGVNLTLTTHKASTAAKLGWKLFSHRIELICPRFGAVLIEAILAVPLVALGVIMVLAAPPEYHIAVAIGAGLLAWLAGALLGVGTAAWWAMLYRQLVLVDRPNAAVALLSSRQPEDARRAPLALIVALGTILVGAALFVPWLQLA